ncbi:FAD-dependent monooxygenase [Microbacteriaceae bacterium K1510]|nr:FAD-dependent monooxygenase [Microbacteriaceae bacterium K1510]
MLEADIGIIGGGLAGSLAAAMLGRAGISTVLIDLHHPYPPDFRCEKIDGRQLRLLAKTGLADEILKSATPMREIWLARYGRVIEKRPSDEAGFFYQDFVNAARAEIPDGTRFIRGRVSSLSTSDQRQTVQLSNGESYSVRLVIVATGLNNNVRQQLQVTREERSPCHSVSAGFDIKPKESGTFAFPALTYFGEHPRSRVGYITLFPIGPSMRANLFVYRDMSDPWLRALRETPQATLFAAMPRLKKHVGNFELTSGIDMRPVDLYVTHGHRQPGVVLVGDAFCTSCPAAGTGVTKVLTDVERLCNVYIPQWLASDGMTADKTAAYYDDHEKRASDAYSARQAYYMRSLAIDRALRWRVRRVGWFSVKAAGTALRGLRKQFTRGPAPYAASSEADEQPSPLVPAEAGTRSHRPEIEN